jgi:bloom syndrome protein
LTLQVRSSPRKARAKAPAATKTKKQQTQFPSTNVPSPVRAPKQKIKSFAYKDAEDEDAFDAPRHPTRNKIARGYQADGFVVDDEGDDPDFAPVRIAKTSKVAKPKGLGVPITEDQRTAGLTDLQHDVLRDFMDGAKDLRGSIQERKALRYPIFTDTALREMGLELPQNLDEMKTLPGIRPEMVDLYGKQFLSLIHNTRDCYGDQTPVPRNPALRNRPAQRPQVVQEIDDDEEVDDQNHRLVVDLCSDDDDEEEVPVAAEEEESDYSYGDGDDDDDVVHTSHFFSQHPDVADFNNQFAQAGGGAAPSNKAPKAPAARGGKASGGGYKKKGSYKKRASGSFGKSFGGVKKRAPKASGSRASGGAATARKPSEGGGRGGAAAREWGNIMAMPT